MMKDKKLEKAKQFARYIRNLETVLEGKPVFVDGERYKFLFFGFTETELYKRNALYHNPSHYEFKSCFLRYTGECEYFNVYVEIELLTRIRKCKKKSLQLHAKDKDVILEELPCGEVVLGGI